MPLKNLSSRLSKIDLSPAFAVITRIGATSMEARGLRPGVGDIVRIVSNEGSQESLGMVTALENDGFNISPFGFVEGFKIGARVYAFESGLTIPVGEGLLG
ncbi:MAG: flagellar export apparatus, flagellum-specific synthase FliI, partial [Pseudomonadota bacterium]